MNPMTKTRQEEFRDEAPKMYKGIELQVNRGLLVSFSALNGSWIVNNYLIKKLLYFFDQNSVFREAFVVYLKLFMVASVLIRYLSIEANLC